jgi:hypothetical protein
MGVIALDIARRGLSKFPRRPDGRIRNEAIPLFYIWRTKEGFWAAREAEGRAGGIFLFKRSALRFAARNSALAGCATMLLTERFELEVENQGNPLIIDLNAVLRAVARRVTSFAAFIARAFTPRGSFSRGLS